MQINDYLKPISLILLPSSTLWPPPRALKEWPQTAILSRTIAVFKAAAAFVLPFAYALLGKNHPILGKKRPFVPKKRPFVGKKRKLHRQQGNWRGTRLITCPCTPCFTPGLTALPELITNSKQISQNARLLLINFKKYPPPYTLILINKTQN